MDIIRNYIPGAIGKITELHAAYYHKYWGFGLYFESKVATELSEFLRRYDENRDGIWLALKEEEIVGSIVIDGIAARTKGAHLRWFIVAHEYMGQGIGDRLMSEAVDFCKGAGYSRIYLWTFAGLDAARHLYEKWGFSLKIEQEGEQWGKRVLEQMFELDLQ